MICKLVRFNQINGVCLVLFTELRVSDNANQKSSNLHESRASPERPTKTIHDATKVFNEVKIVLLGISMQAFNQLFATTDTKLEALLHNQITASRVGYFSYAQTALLSNLILFLQPYFFEPSAFTHILLS